MLNIPKPFAIRGRAFNWPSPKTQSPEWFGIFAWIFGPVSKTSPKTFWQTKLKICCNEFQIETRHDLQCEPNDCFYMKYNTRLKYNNTTSFPLNNFLLKCAQHMLDVFPTENLSIHPKILIGIKNQFDLHKLLYIFSWN